MNQVDLSDTIPSKLEKPCTAKSAVHTPLSSVVHSEEEDDHAMVANEVRTRFSELISHMSEAEMKELIEALEKEHKPEPADHRKHVRKPSKIIVNFSIDNFPFTNFIQNISASGAYIETSLPFSTNKALSMTFILPGNEDAFQITGKIVRSDSTGIGVEFDELLKEV